MKFIIALLFALGLPVAAYAQTPPAGYPSDLLPKIDALPADRSISAQVINSATSNANVTSPLGYGQATVGYLISGLTASGATLTPEFTNDPALATGWTAASVVQGGAIVSTVTADGSLIQIGAPHAGVRLRVSTAGTGNITISTNASVAAIDPQVYVELVGILAKLNGTVAVSGSFSAAGFAPSGNYAALSVTTSTGQTALPSGSPTVVAANNAGVNPVWVNLGTSSSVTATTGNISIPAGCTVPLTVGSNANLAAISTGAGSTLNLYGGSGLFSPFCAGGSSGGGGSVTQGTSPWVTADNGTKITAATIPAGGTGLTGWLSAIWYQLTQGIGVTGTFWQATQPVSATSLPLPTNAATAALQTTGNASLTTIAGNTTNAGTPTLTPGTAGGVSTASAIAPNNTTSVALKASAGQLYDLDGFSISAATPAFIKFYDAAQGSTTCGSGTPKLRYMIPASGAAAGSGFVKDFPNGVPFATAITYCITAAIADNDTTAPAASTYVVNFGYK